MKTVYSALAVLLASSASSTTAQPNNNGNTLQQCFPNDLPFYTYKDTDYIFSRMKYNSVCVDDNGHQYQWGKVEGVYPPIDEPDGGCSKICVSGYGRGEQRGCTSMKPESLVGFNYNCDESACYCLYEKHTWSNDNSPCFDSMNTNNHGKGDVAGTTVKTGSTCYSLSTQPAATPSPTPPAPGSSICTYAPDYECYQSGWPPCCDDGSQYDCPDFPTMCNNHPENASGTSYCTNSPDYDCYSSGWPACCNEPGGDFYNCPKDKPVCENDAKTFAFAAAKFLRGKN